MARIKAFVIAWAGAAALAATAHAADAPDPWTAPPEIERDSEQPREYMSGWYLRGDIGYRYNRIGGISSPNPITEQKYDDTVALTGGFGFKDRWFRADITFDYSTQARYSGTTAAATQQPQYTAKIDNFTVLANAYFDLGTWAGFTPYFGGGAGVSYLRNTGYKDSTLPAAELVPTGTGYNFAWAAMAGVSFQVTPKWIIDMGYRYLSLGDVMTGTDSVNNFTTWKDLTVQEVRVGARFLLD